MGNLADEPGTVSAVYDQALAARSFALSEGLQASHRELLESVLNRPDLQVLLRGVRIAVANSLSQPFRLQAEEEVLLSPYGFQSAATLAVHLRIALELRLLRRLCSPTDTLFSEQALTVLALHTGLRFVQIMGKDEADELDRNASSWLAALAEQVRRGGLLERPADDVVRSLIKHSTQFLQTSDQRATVSSGPLLEHRLSTAIAALLPLACPAEYVLTQGGDDRLQVDPTSGLNGYGCSPKPRPWAITFSSSTASSISDYAYFAVEEWRQSLIAAGLHGGLESRLRQESQRVRKQIHRVLALPVDYDILLTSSGTDAELLALWLVMARSRSGKVVNIIVGPSEVGSGTSAAGAGQHFSSETPSGAQVISGEMIEGMPGQHIRVEEIPIRDRSGTPRPATEIRHAINEIAQRASENDEGILLHVLDASKTGLEMPDPQTVDQSLADHANIVAVIVDAAQMRLSRRRVQSYVERGFLVLVTGSKFFTGPPFSGALLIPDGWLKECPRALETLPAGFSAYATRLDLPASFEAYSGELPPGPNLGLLARWTAALWEMGALYAVAERARRDTIDAFARRVQDTTNSLANIELIAAPSRPLHDDGDEGSWDRCATIFTYRILKAAAARQALELDEGRRAYRWLNRDISGLLPRSASPEDRRLAATCCHTGQPVAFGHDRDKRLAGMRVAAGARLISGVNFDPGLGADTAERLAVELDGLETALRKAALIGRYWTELNAARNRDSAAATGAGF